MSFFNMTEEEARKRIEKKQLNKLSYIISSSTTLNEKSRNVLIKHINNTLAGKSNDFIDADFMCRVFVQLDENEYRDGTTIEEHLAKIISCIKDLLPFGKESNDYARVKELIIEKFVSVNGYINQGIYDKSIIYMFSEPYNYIRLMQTISENNKAVEYFELIKQFINTMGKYAINEEVFLKSVISSINGLNNSIISVKKYLDDQVEEAKKRVGVYSISHDDIQSAANTVSVINRKMAKIESLVAAMESKEIEVGKKAAEGITRISYAQDRFIRELETHKNSLAQNLKHLLDEHLETVKMELQNKSDVVFSEILNRYQEQLNEFKRATYSLNVANTRSLTVLKEETAKSLAQLKNYVTDHPELQNFLDQAEQNSEIRNRLLELISSKDLKTSSDSTDEVIVQGVERLVKPTSPSIILPSSILLPETIEIIPPYSCKTAQDFEKRLKEIELKMKEKEKIGEIYHKKTFEIIKCLMLGDWPYLFGPSGAGKGYIVKQVGELLDQKVIDGGKIGEVHTVLGYIDAQGRFRATPGVEACVNGGIIFYDEFDNGNGDTRVALNTMYSNLRDKINNPASDKYIRFAGEIDIPINPNMRMIAAGNTDGTGCDEHYTDRYPIDESIMERYKAIYIDYDENVEKQMLSSYEAWYNFIKSFREACKNYSTSQSKQNVQGNASTRDVADIKRDIQLDAKTMSEVMNQYFVRIKDKDYRFAIARTIANQYDISSDQTESKNYEGPLSEASGADIAKQFIKSCNFGIRR